MDKEIRLEQKNKELIGKIKFNEKSRRKMQQSLMKQINDLEQQCKKQKEVIDKAVKYIDDLRDESAEKQGFYNCFPDDLYIPDINELLQILDKGESNE